MLWLAFYEFTKGAWIINGQNETVVRILDVILIKQSKRRSRIYQHDYSRILEEKLNYFYIFKDIEF